MSSKPLPKRAASQFLHASSEATVVTDKEGIIIFVNREAETLFGYEAAELLGQPVEVLMPESHRGQHEKHVHRFGKAPRSRPMVGSSALRW